MAGITLHECRDIPLTATLARFVAETPLSEIPETARMAGRLALLNWFGCAIAGAQEDAVSQMLAAFAATGCTGSVPVLGRVERLNTLAATTTNGTASAILDFDSPQHKRTNIHPSGPIAPALLALAATAGARPVSGADFLAAYLMGVEVACRIANTVFGTRNPGWHVTGVAGGPGAAAAAARLMGAGAETTATAIGIAATQGSGLREMYGTMCKALTPGRAGENGLLAAHLALRGFTSAALPIEGKAGLAAVFTGTRDLDALIEGLGRDYEIDAMAHKPYPCAVVSHAVIDACIALSAEIPINAIEKIELTVSPIALQLAGIESPITGLESKFSLGHAAAVALMNRAARVEHFNAAALACPQLESLRARTTIATKPHYRKEEASVRLVHSGGRTKSLHVARALGSPENPMGEFHLTSKFVGLVEPVTGPAAATRLAELVLTLDAQPNLAAILDLCVPGRNAQHG